MLKIEEDKHMNSLEVTGFITALANAIACRFNTEELGLIAAIIVQLGDTLATIAITEEVRSEK